ncbi:hypothetical protein ES708_28378 [subsurface metagenome]
MGKFERKGNTLDPEGKMSSVVILSPNFNCTSNSIFFLIGSFKDREIIFGPLITFTFLEFFAGGIIIESSIIYGISLLISMGSIPKSLGSVILPVKAEAAAVSGLVKYTKAFWVPLLPMKFRL